MIRIKYFSCLLWCSFSHLFLLQWCAITFLLSSIIFTKAFWFIESYLVSISSSGGWEKLWLRTWYFSVLMIYHWDWQVQNTQHGLKDWRSRKNWCWNLCPKFGRLGRFNVAAQVQRLSDGRVSFCLREAIHLCYDLMKSTLLTKVCLVKAMVFSVVRYRCESWTVKKPECQRIDAFELWCWRRLLRVPWTARSNQSILKEISPEYSLEGLMLKLKLQYFGDLMWRLDVLEKTLMLGKVEGGRRRGGQRMR